VRFWSALVSGAEGRTVWLGSASFDRGVGLSHDTGQITHHIDPDLDAERSYLIGTLTHIGALLSTYEVSGVGPTLSGRNGEGDRYFTDGEITIGVIDPLMQASRTSAALPNPPAVVVKGHAWSAIVAVGRYLHLLPDAKHH